MNVKNTLNANLANTNVPANNGANWLENITTAPVGTDQTGTTKNNAANNNVN